MSLPKELFPESKFPELYVTNPSKPLTPEQIAEMKRRAAEHDKHLDELKAKRSSVAGIGEQAQKWTDTPLFDPVEESGLSPKDKKEVEEAQKAFVRLMLQMRDLTDNAPSNPAGIARFLDQLSDLVDAELVARGWQSQPLHENE